jgi:sec-independent protein translocase protein TatB
MFGIGMTELMVIFVIGLLVLGPKRLPELARSLGKSLAEFRRASTELRREFMDVAEETRIPLDDGDERRGPEPRPHIGGVRTDAPSAADDAAAPGADAPPQPQAPADAAKRDG